MQLETERLVLRLPQLAETGSVENMVMSPASISSPQPFPLSRSRSTFPSSTVGRRKGKGIPDRRALLRAIVEAEEERTRQAYARKPDSEREADNWSNAEAFEA